MKTLFLLPAIGAGVSLSRMSPTGVLRFPIGRMYARTPMSWISTIWFCGLATWTGLLFLQATASFGHPLNVGPTDVFISSGYVLGRPNAQALVCVQMSPDDPTATCFEIMDDYRGEGEWGCALKPIEQCGRLFTLTLEQIRHEQAELDRIVHEHVQTLSFQVSLALNSPSSASLGGTRSGDLEFALILDSTTPQVFGFISSPISARIFEAAARSNVPQQNKLSPFSTTTPSIANSGSVIESPNRLAIGSLAGTKRDRPVRVRTVGKEKKCVSASA